MNKFRRYLQILILLVGCIYPSIASSQGTSCEAPIDLNPFIPENGNGNYKLSVDNSESSQFYSYTATQVGHIEMSSAFSNVPGDGTFDSYLRVYDEQCQIIFDEDDSPGLFGGVEFYSEVSIGDTYIFEWSNHEWAGKFEVEFIYHAPVTGESCDDSVDLITGSNTVDFWFGNQSFVYMAPSAGLLEISTCDLWNAEGSNIMLLDGCDGNEIGISSDECDYDIVGWESITYELEEGEEVIVKMVGALHKHHDYTFNVVFTPEGEACDLSFDLSILPEDIHQVPHACTTCRTNKWYEFIAPKTGEVVVTTGQAALATHGGIGGQENTYIKVYSVCDGEPIAENAEYYQFFGSSHIEIEFQEGETYYIEFVADDINDAYHFDIFYLEDLSFGTEESPLEVTPGLNADHANMYYAGEQYEIGEQWFSYEFEEDGELKINVTNYYDRQTLVSVISENDYQFTYPDDDSGPDGFSMSGVTGDVVLIGLSRTNNTFSATFEVTCEPEIISVSAHSCDEFEFDDVVLTESGDYTATFLNQLNCDSTVNLNLTIIKHDLTITSDVMSLTVAEPKAMYQWYDCSDNSLLFGETSETIIPIQTGQYRVEVTKDGCSEMSECVVFEEPLSSTSLSELKIYPNPTTGKSVIDLGESQSNVSVQISALDGRTVFLKRFKNVSQVPLEFQGPNGIYFVEVKVSGKPSEYIKILKH